MFQPLWSAMAQPAVEAAHRSVCFPGRAAGRRRHRGVTDPARPRASAHARGVGGGGEAAAAAMAFRSGGRLGTRAGWLGLPFRGPEQLCWPEEQAEGGWAHARYPGPPAGGAAQGGSGVVGVPRVPPLRPGCWQGRTGSSGSVHGRKPEAAEAGSPGQQHQGGEGGSCPKGPMGKRKGDLPDRNFPLRRGGQSQKRKHSQIWNQNLITCYSQGSQACGPQHPPSADMVHQRSGHNVRSSNRLFFSQEHFQGYQRPSFQELNPHGSLQQHRNQIDKQHYWIP
ncbi:hypothetical protein E2320_006809 [Naja naja]|nr:hypothetical protein E2320_006809 [Naja naja]